MRSLLLLSSLVFVIPFYALYAQSVVPPPPPAPQAPPPEKQGSALPEAPPCIGCYKGFKFDTVFRMGAHFNGAWPGAARFLKDTLHIGITQMYHQPYLWEIVRDTVLSGGNDTRSVWANKLRLQFWQGLKDADVKLIMEPGNVSAIAKGAEMAETYFGQAEGKCSIVPFRGTSVELMECVCSASEIRRHDNA